jgi:hypothetical protein
MMHQQVAHALSHDLRVLRGPLRGFTLRQDRERSAFPTSDEVSAPAVRCADHTGNAPYAGIACGPVESLVVGGEVVDVEQGEPDLMRIALRQRPVAL